MFGFVSGGLSTTSTAAKDAGFNAIANAFNGLSSIYMEFPKGNDDVLAVKRVTITAPGQTQTIQFRSNAEDATYDVTFKHVLDLQTVRVVGRHYPHSLLVVCRLF